MRKERIPSWRKIDFFGFEDGGGDEVGEKEGRKGMLAAAA